MSTVPIIQRSNAEYPTSDGRPMAETDLHRDLMTEAIAILKRHFADRPTYVTGNILVFYEPGNKRRHVSPDVWVAHGVPMHRRLNFLIWEEPRGPQAVIELTSSSTRDEDIEDKFALYRDVLKVTEYFLFDPYGDYLTPPLQGYRLEAGQYRPIEPIHDRLPSEVFGLHLERDRHQLRFYDPHRGDYLLTSDEELERERAERQAIQDANNRLLLERQEARARSRRAEEAAQAAERQRRQAEEAAQAAERQRRQAEEAAQAAEQQRQEEAERRRQAEAQVQQAQLELERLKAELERLRGGSS